MSIEILESRVVLPAFIFFKENEQEKQVFVYIDQLAGDIIIPDESSIGNVEAFRRGVNNQLRVGVRPIETPPMPKDGFSKINNPEEFLEI